MEIEFLKKWTFKLNKLAYLLLDLQHISLIYDGSIRVQ